MLEGLMAVDGLDISSFMLAGLLGSLKNYLLIFIGFSLVIFFHELGHFVAAKACGVRVHKFAIGFGREVCGFTRGETRYALNLLPLGGYVKMLGQEDFEDKGNELIVKDDPRAFSNKSVGKRMIIVSAGVVMNLIFAAVVFMLTFMIGIESLPAEVGWLQPGSPAERVGLRVGDTIVKVNKQNISDQSDLRSAVVLSDPDEPLDITFERKAPGSEEVRTETVTIRPEMNSDQNILQIGVAPPLNSTVAAIVKEPALSDDGQLQVGDEVLEVDGRQVSTFHELDHALAAVKGRFADIQVRRPSTLDPDVEPTYTQRTVKWRGRAQFAPEGRLGQVSGHLLGMVPRVRITEVIPGQRAEQAGLAGGDVIVRWGNQVAPRVEEIQTSILDNPETEIPVVVLRFRNGKTEELSFNVRPKVPGIFIKRKPAVGMQLVSQENDQAVVADIIEAWTDDAPTPTAALKGIMPRGSRITKVNDEPVETWSELTENLIALAGTDVKLSWSYEGQPETSGTIYVPQTLGTTSSGARLITSIDGISRIEVDVNGRRKFATVNHWMGTREVLRKSVGKTVAVEYWDQLDRQLHTEQLAVTPEMVHPWVLRVQYNVNDVITDFERIMVRETNPAKAMMIGMRKTYYFIVQVYVTMKRMIVTRSMGLDQISGPVGIIKMGSDIAAAGISRLMYFLALISANLAVINFLPLPIFDGGLFVFLLIEKIKGQPVSLKVQVATQFIGLVLIIGIFLFVTFQDIAKMAGWG